MHSEKNRNKSCYVGDFARLSKVPLVHFAKYLSITNCYIISLVQLIEILEQHFRNYFLTRNNRDPSLRGLYKISLSAR
jgi:hypothetical protein